MKTFLSAALYLVFVFLSNSCGKSSLPVLETGGNSPLPDEWIDKDTGHKIRRLTGPDGNNRSFYFHNNPFLAGEGRNPDRMIYYGNIPDNTDDRDFTPRGNRQLYVMDLKTLANRQITRHSGYISGEIVGRETGKVYYQCRDSVFSSDIETGVATLVYVFPDSIRGGITTLNADETLLGGVASGREKYELLQKYPMKRDFFNRIYEAKLKHTLITIDVKTGTLNEIFSDTAWLNHVQFSPTDPALMMFCHEGPWHLVNRIWTIDINRRDARMMHKRTVDGEIAGHEFFSPDGNTIWFDLQMPRGEMFYLAGLDLASGTETRYGLQRDEWSVHFNISPDQKIFAGDGGDQGMVAHAEHGTWLYLFRPDGDSLRSEKLVNMKHHNYDLEPNVHFSTDAKWIIFRANFEGSSQIYAVETGLK